MLSAIRLISSSLSGGEHLAAFSSRSAARIAASLSPPRRMDPAMLASVALRWPSGIGGPPAPLGLDDPALVDCRALDGGDPRIGKPCRTVVSIESPGPLLAHRWRRDDIPAVGADIDAWG